MFVDRAGCFSAFVDCTDDERLAAAQVAGREDSRHALEN